jgi:hypothetical protein
MFHLQDDPEPLPQAPTARADDKGAFQVTTFQSNDGLPVGKYKVTVVWQKLIVHMGQEQPGGPDMLEGKYNDPKTTPLEASVTKGMGPLTFELKERVSKRPTP